MNLPTEPRFAHSYDPDTRAYMGKVRLQPSPDGAWNLPDFTVDVAPRQPAGEYQALRLAEDRSRWELVADFRNCMLWDTRTAMAVPNRLALGEPLPKDVTLSEPFKLDGTTAQYNAWNASRREWTLLPDYSSRPLWNKHDASFATPVSRGVALPPSVTDLAPPADRSYPVTFDEARAAWVMVTAPEPDPAAQPQPQPQP
ncbi:hypothetical protein I5U57_09955 [Stenotrophomonas maltophilia]|uniref:Uncharacterized protein n=2 Tax=Stenotrophomonas TaxID=40323 RepID=A0AA40XZR6_STEMA|nr:hypothetical protein [Stenotrophomonas maltophilia]